LKKWLLNVLKQDFTPSLFDLSFSSYIFQHLLKKHTEELRLKRGRLKLSESGCYHLTHRCQERKFLLRFEIDRKNYLNRLRETSQKYCISVLDYMVTSNHIHLLIFSPDTDTLSSAMKFLQGAVARDFNRRKKREGAFWTGRFRPTLIQSGPHLSRCLFYIGLNMVRAGEIDHPSKWHCCGYQELSGKKQRYRIIDKERLFKVLSMGYYPDQFYEWYNKTMESSLKSDIMQRQAIWTECAAVGDKYWIEKLADSFVIGKKEIVSYSPQQYQQNSEKEAFSLKEDFVSYGIKITSGKRSDFIKSTKKQNMH
jgi:putative transposase